MAAFGFNANEETYQKLIASYSQKHRHYHTQAHVNACLRHLDRCKSQANNASEIEIALWFHDAVYNPFRGDNELVSAEWAATFLNENGAAEELAQRVHRLIMVTEHDSPTQTQDESLLVDVDLSILGANTEVYDQFEINVRKEYKRIPMFIYKKKRVEVLKGFLERSAIYNNEPLRSELESQARLNLSNAIEQLQAR